MRKALLTFSLILIIHLCNSLATAQMLSDSKKISLRSMTETKVINLDNPISENSPVINKFEFLVGFSFSFPFYPGFKSEIFFDVDSSLYPSVGLSGEVGIPIPSPGLNRSYYSLAIDKRIGNRPSYFTLSLISYSGNTKVRGTRPLGDAFEGDTFLIPGITMRKITEQESRTYRLGLAINISESLSKASVEPYPYFSFSATR